MTLCLCFLDKVCICTKPGFCSVSSFRNRMKPINVIFAGCKGSKVGKKGVLTTAEYYDIFEKHLLKFSKLLLLKIER